MWTSKGRSGFGDSTIGGDYDSWDGVSPNGKQYKNEATMETRDLSGADYWHLRKQNRPTEAIPASLHMLNKGRANIDAYACLDEPVKKKSSIPLIDKILPQQRRVLTLTQQMIDLESEYKQNLHSPEEYTLLRNVLSVKRQRAEFLLKRAISVKPIQHDTEQDEYQEQTQEYSGEYGSQNGVGGTNVPQWLQGVSSTNSLKKPLIKACNTWKKAVEFKHKMSNYLNTLKAL